MMIGDDDGRIHGGEHGDGMNNGSGNDGVRKIIIVAMIEGVMVKLQWGSWCKESK